MAIQFINTGTSANAGNGDTLRSAFNKVNINFIEIQNSLTNISSFTPVAIPIGDTGNFLYYPYNGINLRSLPSLNWLEQNRILRLGSADTSTFFQHVTNFHQTGTAAVSFQQFHSIPDSNNYSFVRGRGTNFNVESVKVGDEIADIIFTSYNGDTPTSAVNLAVTVEIVNTSTSAAQADLFFSTNDGTGLRETVRLTSTGSWKTDKLDAHTTGSNITVHTGLIPSVDLAYDLGSAANQWRSLYVGTGTIYIGGVSVTVNTVSNTLVVGAEPGTSPSPSTNLATESFVINYVATNGGGGGGGLEIDGGNASTDYTAEILVDGGEA